jgi:hypothetical protein
MKEKLPLKFKECLEQETKGVTRHARRKEGDKSFRNWLHGKRKSETQNNSIKT